MDSLRIPTPCTLHSESNVKFTISDFLPSSCPFDLPGPQYRLEKQCEPNVAVDLESTLESQSAWEFCLVRENSSRADGVFEEDSQIDIATVQDMLSSHHYKSFKVSMIHRLRFTTDVQLATVETCQVETDDDSDASEYHPLEPRFTEARKRPIQSESVVPTSTQWRIRIPKLCGAVTAAACLLTR
ncbi:hypothetical protein MC885_011226 [Smutsia gigantea]|nr:hypothetical protein MC885_011226 [Smutsia gigantea]